MVCDFCSTPNPTRTYHCKTFQVTIFPIARSVEDWAACLECAQLIDEDRWEDLADRASKLFMVENYTPEDLATVREFMLQLHQQFKANRLEARKEKSA